MTGSQPYDAGDLPCAQPAESIEQRQPLLIESLEVWNNGEGPGYRRSGFGVVRRIQILSEDSQLNVMADRSVIPTLGVGGGAAWKPHLDHRRARRQRDSARDDPGQDQVFPVKIRRCRADAWVRGRRRRRSPGPRGGDYRERDPRGLREPGASRGRVRRRAPGRQSGPGENQRAPGRATPRTPEVQGAGRSRRLLQRRRLPPWLDESQRGREARRRGW